MLNDIRFTAAAKGSPLSDAIFRAMQEPGGLSVTSMRAGGFRMLEQASQDSAFRALAPLPDKAQVLIDKAVVKVGLQRLSFVADLLAEGLTFPLTDPLSVTQLEWNQMSKVGAAQRSMSPSARTENSLPIISPNRLPIYLTLDGFNIDIRTLKVSQRAGIPLDTTMVEQATRAVNEAVEDAAINGATTLDGQDLTDSGYTAPGLMNAPHANTQSITVAAWTSAPVGTTVLNETLAMIATEQADKKFGPYNLYVGTIIGNALENDFKANGDLTIKQRLEQIVAGGRNIRVRTVDFLPANKVALVQMTSDVVECVVGQMPTVIPWTSLDGFTVHNLVMSIMVPRMKWDYEGNSGICIGS